jgi:uncharacterized protein (TIGR03083 family)
MTLSRDVVVPGMLAEYQSFTQLVWDISDADWEKPSRCEAWRVADVAAHVIGQLTDVVSLRLDGLGSPEVTARQVSERKGRTRAELADELEANSDTAKGLAEAFDDTAWEAPAPGGTTGTLGFGMESLWFDTYLHADDIRDALGKQTQIGDGLVASVSHVAQVLTDREWGPATLTLDGMKNFNVSGGGGQTVAGDPMTFVLVSTGRADPGALGLDETVNIYG